MFKLPPGLCLSELKTLDIAQPTSTGRLIKVKKRRQLPWDLGTLEDQQHSELPGFLIGCHISQQGAAEISNLKPVISACTCARAQAHTPIQEKPIPLTQRTRNMWLYKISFWQYPPVKHQEKNRTTSYKVSTGLHRELI